MQEGFNQSKLLKQYSKAPIEAGINGATVTLPSFNRLVIITVKVLDGGIVLMYFLYIVAVMPYSY